MHCPPVEPSTENPHTWHRGVTPDSPGLQESAPCASGCTRRFISAASVLKSKAVLSYPIQPLRQIVFTVIHIRAKQIQSAESETMSHCHSMKWILRMCGKRTWKSPDIHPCMSIPLRYGSPSRTEALIRKLPISAGPGTVFRQARFSLSGLPAVPAAFPLFSCREATLTFIPSVFQSPDSPGRNSSYLSC